jgi:hypothetical protein
MVVTSVREGFPGMPFHAGVLREVSTKVIVVVAAGAELAAPATVFVPTVSSAVAESRNPQLTAASNIVPRVAPISALLPDPDAIVAQGDEPKALV